MISWLRRSLEYLDFFGVNMNMKILKNDQFKTAYGGLLTVIVYSILIYKISLKIKDSITKEDFTFTYENSPELDKNLSLQNYTLAFCPVINVMSAMSFNQYLNFSSVSRKNGPKPGVNLNYTARSCKLNEITTDNTLPVEAKSKEIYCFCFDFANETISSSSRLLADSYLQIAVSFNYTTLPQNILLKLAAYRDYMFTLSVLYRSNFVNTSNFYSPIQGFNSYYLITSQELKTEVDMLYDSLQVNFINDFYTLGLYKSEPEVNTTYQYVRKETKSTIAEKMCGAILFNIRHSANLNKYTFYEFNLEDFMSTFGGYFQVWFVFFTIISHFLNNFFLRKKIEQILIHKSQRTQNLIKKIDQFLFDRNRMIQQQKDNSENTLRCYITDRHLQDTPEEKHQLPYGDLPHNGDIVQHYTNPTKRVNITDSQIDDFEEQFDFDNIFNFFQEVKLISILSLDLQSLNWLCKFKDTYCSINQYEKGMESLQKVENSQENMNSKQSLCEKLEIIRKILNEEFTPKK